VCCHTISWVQLSAWEDTVNV